jgi:ParB family chromosome partitioning protein
MGRGMNTLEIFEAPVAGILVADRVREPDPAVVKALVADIAARGLRQPIEVAARKGEQPWRLVSGAHRLAAMVSLGRETIPAFAVKGNLQELRRDELLENLQRSELSMLERARFMAELRDLWMALHPEARHGGDRRSEEFSSGIVATWSEIAALRTGLSDRTLRRAAEIGASLDREAAALVRGTAAEHSQKDLEMLAAEPAERQRVLASLVNAGTAASVREARLRLNSAPAAPEPTLVERILRLLERASAEERRQVLQHLQAGGA